MTDKHQIADDLTTLAYPIEKLKHLDGNPRKGNVEAVKKSYKKFGQRKPIVATKDGEVISGNHQLAAARELDWNKIAVVFTNDDELTAKAFALADNRTADLGTYDDDLLADMLGSVSSDLELLEATSFDEKDLLALVKKQEVIEDDAPAIRQTEIKLGQKYKLGNHTLVCGDATNKDHIDYLIKDNVIDMVFTDPPYGLNINTDRSNNITGIQQSNKFKQYDDTTNIFAIKNFKLLQDYDIKTQIWFGGNHYAHTLPETNNWLVWDKRVEENLRDLQSDCELAWVKSKYNSIRIFRHLWRGLIKDSENGEKRVHPSQKPIALINFAINEYDNKAQNIIDCFGGSGSTLIACEQLERNCFIMELDPEYCQVIIDRWEKFTGQKAELIDSL
jgi:site-specific DNA-methyltransferase (adenine-specific)